jgi:hypothetical protein
MVTTRTSWSMKKREIRGMIGLGIVRIILESGVGFCRGRDWKLGGLRVRGLELWGGW